MLKTCMILQRFERLTGAGMQVGLMSLSKKQAMFEVRSKSMTLLVGRAQLHVLQDT